MLVLEGLIGLHRAIQLQLLQHYLGIDLDYRGVGCFALETNKDHSAFWTLLLTMMATPFLLRDSFPQ